MAKERRSGTKRHEGGEEGSIAPACSFEPLSEAQAEAQRLFKGHDIMVLTGPAASGKTHIAVALSLAASLSRKPYRPIVCIRPNVLADAPHGHLEGSLQDKLAPFAEPIRHAVSRCSSGVPKDLVRIESLGHSRGVSWNDSFIIVDEAQNCTRQQLVLCLTRLGKGSKIVFAGDTMQSDLGFRPVPLESFAEAISVVKGVAWCRLPEGECHRHPLVAACLQRLSKGA